MVTAEEIAAVPIFAALGEAERERLSRAAADISLVPGEYAAAEGSERALFALLEGRIEAVKLTDGIERVIGERRPGDVFGEVPITLGTVFPVGFRAAEPHGCCGSTRTTTTSWLPRPRTSRRRSAGSPRTGSGASTGCRGSRPTRRPLVRSRSGAARTVRARELRRFLDRNQITFTWISADAPDAVEAWGGPLPAADEWPAIRAVDGGTSRGRRTAGWPSFVGLTTEPAATEYDTVIVGGGPAGMAAAVYGASEGLRTIVVEREAPGARPARRRGSRTTSASRPACRATSSRVARSSRREGSGPRSW